ncbi:ubiquinol-cytochrome-c reductase complex subunit-domain-containing protein [Geopyxis carbonaria]|nr:ubiquinol-cytochrome-c reductase complex subunit-domain-containing protein [Geopyxis carbonaria]
MPAAYRSPYGPKFRPQLHIQGYPLRSLVPLAVGTAAFGGVAVGALLFFGSGIPRVQNDVLKKLPVIGGYWEGRELPASDNPF